ncbi:putative adenine nucleotide alpha hydrolases-like superfamily protein [Tanacetum coccineum]|uniref:Adenine nucleotide alpha hydrolases-like superfamily protein n=1 Tax=Tanacetum coccineum TaxID=301880 RepID=A0ABQ5BHF6_9ASTR
MEVEEEVRKIVVIVEEVEVAKTALVWALHNVLRFGDLVTLLHVFPVNNERSKSRNRKKVRLLRLKGFQLALSFKDIFTSFPKSLHAVAQAVLASQCVQKVIGVFRGSKLSKRKPQKKGARLAYQKVAKEVYEAIKAKTSEGLENTKDVLLRTPVLNVLLVLPEPDGFSVGECWKRKNTRQPLLLKVNDARGARDTLG